MATKKNDGLIGKLPAKPVDTACFYAQNFGWRIMPLHSMRLLDGKMGCSCGDADCDAPGKHPLVKNGEASNDPDRLRVWWKKWPWANLGFWLEGSGLAVLDIDISPDKDGAKRLVEILNGEPLPRTLVCETPSGGKHLYFKEREGLPNKSNALGAGLDIWRGKHYVILPPSNHRKGGNYKWEGNGEPPADWPDVLMPRRGRPPGTPNPNAGRPASRERIDPNDASEVKRLCHALTFIDASDRDTWVHVGYALARCFKWSDKGWEIYREWSATAQNYNEKESRHIYSRDSYNPPDTQALTTAYIFKKATENPKFSIYEPPSDQRLRFFQTTAHEHEDLITLSTLIASTDLPIYEREGRLIEVIRIDQLTVAEKERLFQSGIERSDTYCITRELSTGQFIHHASKAIVWWQKGKSGKFVPTDFNRVRVNDFLGMGSWPGMRMFRAFTLHPTIRSLENPTLLTTSGFDAESGLFLEQPLKITVPPKPTLKDARAALKVLLTPYQHFAFIEPDKGKAGLLALLLTIGIRHCFKTAPMFLASSPIVGSGKTKLMTSAATLWYGAPPPAMGFVEDEEEMEKRIGSSAMAGDRVLLFDNVMAQRAVNDRTLNMVLTSGRAEFRVLGESRKIRLSTPMTVMMTGNQMALGADLARRTIEIKIDPQGPDPTKRQFPFEPIEFVVQHRKTLLEAALTILTAFFQVRSKLPVNRPVASFEEWSVVRDIILWLEIADLSVFAAEITDDDTSYPAVVQRVIAMLADVREIDLFTKKAHASDLVPLLVARGTEWMTLFHDLCDLIGYGGGDSRVPKHDDPRSVGALLSRLVDQVIAIEGRTIRLKSIKRRTFWLVEE